MVAPGLEPKASRKRDRARRFLSSLVGKSDAQRNGEGNPSQEGTSVANASSDRLGETRSENKDVPQSIETSVPEAPSVHVPRRHQAQSNIEKLSAASWNGIQVALKGAEKCLDGTPAKAFVALANIIIDIKTKLDDNDETLNSLCANTAKLLRVVDIALKDEVPDPDQMVKAYSTELRQELAVLIHMSDSRRLATKIANIEEDKRTFTRCLEDIKAGVITLHLHLVLRNAKHIHAIYENTKFQQLCLAPKAIYNADLGENVSLPRSPCTVGTRVPVLKAIIDWAESSALDCPPVYWLTGPAGTGKTTIAYTVAQYFDNLPADSEYEQSVVLGGNFLCSRQFEETRRRIKIIPTIAYQLAGKCRFFSDALPVEQLDLIRGFREQVNKLLVIPWRSSREGIPKAPSPQYLIIIDALDELNNDEGAMFLADLLITIDSDETSLPGLKFLITSRSDPKVEYEVKRRRRAFSSTFDAICRLQDIPVDNVQADIRLYLEESLPYLKSRSELDALLDRSAGLFIFAATVIRYLDGGTTVKDKLTLLNQLLSFEVLSYCEGDEPSEEPFLIDSLYQYILRDAFSKLRSPIRSSHLIIMHTFLTTIERTSPSIVADLLPESDEETALTVLHQLHAVFYTKNDQIFWYHASFPDFIHERSRSNFTIDGRSLNMSCNAGAHHFLLARSCFRLMECDLRFNICDIPSSYLLDREVEGLAERIQSNIKPSLRYAARYWAEHVSLALGYLGSSGGASGTEFQIVSEDIANFLDIRCLFWFETMNLLGLQGELSSILRKVRDCLINFSESRLAEELDDAARFSWFFGASPAALSTPHLYLSSLPAWSQHTTPLCHRWRNQFLWLPNLLHSQSNNIPLLEILAPDTVHSIAFSSDGKRIVSGSNKSLRIWDTGSGVQLHELTGHSSTVRSIFMSQDDQWVISGSCEDDCSVRLWDLKSGEQVHQFNGHTNGVFSVSISFDDKPVVVSGSLDGSVRVWDPIIGEQSMELQYTAPIVSVAVSGPGKLIASGSIDGSITIWDAISGNKMHQLKGHQGVIMSLAFAPDGSQIVSGARDCTVRLWDSNSAEELRRLDGHFKAVMSVAFSFDGKCIASGSDDRSVKLWDVASGKWLMEFDGGSCSIISVAFSRDGKWLAAAGGNTIRVWDATPREGAESLNGHSDALWSVAFSPDDRRIASSSSDNTVKIWDAVSGEQLLELVGHQNWVMSIAFSKGGERLFSGAGDKTIRAWDTESGHQIQEMKGHTEGIMSIALSNDDRRIVSGSRDNSVRLWDIETGAQLLHLVNHTNWVPSVAFSNDNKQLVSGSFDRSLKVWDAESGEQLQDIKVDADLNTVTFSNDGKRIISGWKDGIVRVWDTLTGEILHEMGGHTGLVRSVALSRDGRYIVSGSHDSSLRVWAAESGKQLQVLMGHVGGINSVAFSNDGQRVVSGADDRLIVVSSPFHNDADEDPNIWTSVIDGWILPSAASKRRMIWIPQHMRRGLYFHHTQLILSRYGTTKVDFTGCRFGRDWASCYEGIHVDSNI